MLSMAFGLRGQSQEADFLKFDTLNGTFSSLSRALNLNAFSFPLTAALAGAGGKTSLLFCLAREQRAAGKRVLVYTTTHMQRDLSAFWPEAGDFLTSSGQKARSLLLEKGFAVLGAPAAPVSKASLSGQEAFSISKITWPGAEACREASREADLILVEADGSRQLPCKFPGPKEPVIPPDARLILTVQGLAAIGQDPRACCHRLELAAPFLSGGPVVTETDLGRLMRKGYLEPLRARFPHAKVIPVYHQADTEELAQKALSLLFRQKEKDGIVSTLLLA